MLQLAEKNCDGNLPPSKPLTLRATILFQQCSVEINAGYSGIVRAIPKFEAANKIQQAALEEMDRDGVEIRVEHEIPLANGLNNLGCCYLHLSRLRIKEKKKWSHNKSMVYEFAESYKNMAIIRVAQNEINQALEITLKSVNPITHDTGAKSSRTYFFRFIYACILFESGDLESALRDHLEILLARKKILSEAHNYTASSCYMSGFTYYHLQKFSEAEWVEILDIDTRVQVSLLTFALLSNDTRINHHLVQGLFTARSWSKSSIPTFLGSAYKEQI